MVYCIVHAYVALCTRMLHCVHVPPSIDTTISQPCRYDVLRSCVVNLELSESNKGLEGMHYHWDGKQGESVSRVYDQNASKCMHCTSHTHETASMIAHVAACSSCLCLI